MNSQPLLLSIVSVRAIEFIRSILQETKEEVPTKNNNKNKIRKKVGSEIRVTI